jgi:hypothetical protein
MLLIQCNSIWVGKKETFKSIGKWIAVFLRREARLFKFLYKLLAKPQRDAFILITLRSHSIGVNPANSSIRSFKRRLYMSRTIRWEVGLEDCKALSI